MTKEYEITMTGTQREIFAKALRDTWGCVYLSAIEGYSQAVANGDTSILDEDGCIPLADVCTHCFEYIGTHGGLSDSEFTEWMSFGYGIRLEFANDALRSVARNL